MEAKLFQYTLIRRGDEYIRTQVAFVNMNPEEIFFISRVLQLKSEKYHKMKIAWDRVCEFFKDLVCDFTRIDAEIYPILAMKFIFPELDPVVSFTNGFQEMSLGATNY